MAEMLFLLLLLQEETVALEPARDGASAYDALGVVRVSFKDSITLGDDVFKVEAKGDDIVVDADGDGKPETPVAAAKGGSVLLRRPSGEYVVRIESIMTKKGGKTATRSWLYRTGTLMKGKGAAGSVTLLDGNGNGRFNDVQADAIVVDSKKLMLDARVAIKGTWWEVKPAADGRSVTMRDTAEKVPAGGSAPAVVKEINDLRAAVGVGPVRVDAALTKACDRHCAYLQSAGWGKGKTLFSPHDEDPKRSGYSKEGAAAAMNSYIGWGHKSPGAFFRSNLQTWYHRINYVCPDLDAVGVAQSGIITAIDVGSCRVFWAKLTGPIVLPYDGMDDVPLNYATEAPNPITDGRDARVCGVAIQCIFPPAAKLADAKIEVEDQYGNAVGGYLNLPGKLFKTDFAFENVIGMIPNDALAPATKYYVTVTCAWDEKPYAREWSFTTGGK